MAEQTEVPQVQEVGPSGGVVQRLFERERVLVFLAVFVAEIAIYLFGMFVPMDLATRQSLYNQTNSAFGFLRTAGPLQIAAYIFVHNLQIAILEMVPLIGVYYFLLSIFSTGLATQAIVASGGYPAWFGLILFAFPYSIVELSAYAIAVTSGLMLILAWWKKGLRGELPVFLVEAGLVAGVLLLAATMETLTTYDLLAGFGLWIPVGAAGIGLALFRRRSHG